MKKAIINISINFADHLIVNGVILIDGKIIEAAVPVSEVGSLEDYELIDGINMLAASGYIDSHIHGGNDFDCNDGTEEAVIGMSDFYVKHGIAAYFPSTSSDPLEKIEKGFETIRSVMKNNSAFGVEILGTHMEGPFINKEFKGCQAEDQILEMTDENFAVVKRNKDIIKRITIAPEIPANFERIEQLADMGIVISGGHSSATGEQVVEAHKKGMNMITHLYCAMSSITKDGPYKIPGMLEKTLSTDSLYTEIIADCRHLSNELMKIAYKCKGPDKLMVCSDANRGAGSRDGGAIFTCGQEAVIENGVAMVPDRSSFASSITPIDQMVRNLVNALDIPRHDALNMASATPAKMMGIFDRKGSIAKGKDADIILLDDDLNVKMTICRGEICFSEL
ncbi:MAG: N-acetylglucosamine-6-phosphate deacetylase [Planctomycetota bacterium]|jgi:N-acetylglucosamine-6-phosphate deacetylase